MDGEVIIDINADESKFDRKMDKLEQKLKNEKLDLDIKTGNVEDAKRELQEVMQELEKVKKKRDELNKTFQSKKSQYENLNQRIDNGESLTPDEYLRYGSLENTITKLKSQVNQTNAEFEKQNNLMNKSVDNLTKAETQQEKQKQKVVETTKEIQRLNEERKKSQISNIKDAIENIGKETEKTIKKVGKWALAIFGIRSAYLMVRKAASTISQYDEQVKADLQYIQIALASILEPVIKRIIELVYKLLQYLQIIIYQWTGKNIFANANKALKKMTGSAKELKKQLAGFDEMNVLSDSSSSGGVTAPSVDLGKMAGDMPEWVKWIVENGELLKNIIIGIGIAIAALKIGEFLQNLGLFSGLPLWQLVAGLALTIGGIVLTIKGIIDFIKDPTWQNFMKILEGIALVVAGIAILFGAWPVALGAAIALIIIEIVKHFDQIKGFFRGLITWIDENVLGGLRKLFGPLGDILYAPIKYLLEFGMGAFEAFYGGIKRIIDGVVKIFKGDFWGGIKDIFGGLLSVLTAPLQGFLKAVQSVVGLVLNFFNQMWGKLKEIGVKAGEIISGAFKAVVNAILGAVESVLNTPIKTINGLIGTINKVPGINLSKLSTFNLPRLAKGTILNAPGKGVPVAGGSAVAGEAGREAYLPLSDTQLLEELGSTIGKYININATIPVYMGNRQVVREFRKISAEDDFAYNR